MLKDIVKNLEPSSTLKINEISKELEIKGKKIFKFGFGQSPFQVPKDIVEELKNNAHKNKYLSMQGLDALRKNIAKHRQVSVYILVEKYEIICNFEKNGSIHIDLDLNNLISVEEAEQIIKTAIKPLLSTVGDFLGQSGYSYLIFDKLNDPNITIKNITYASEISIKKKFNITKFNNCISSIFNIIDSKLKDGIILRFKRTSYFKKEESK